MPEKDKSINKESAARPNALGRNDPCHCGSAKKYKKCCMTKDEAAEHKTFEEQWKKSSAAAKERAEEGKAAGTPSAPAKHSNQPQPKEKRHSTFVPHQVSMPRKSGGGG